MSAAVSFSNAASMLAGDSSPQAPADIGRAEDVYAAWKAVFERSRAVESTRDGAHTFERDARQPRGESPVRSHASDAQTGSSRNDAPGSNDDLRTEASRSSRAGVSSQTIARSVSGSNMQSAPWSGSSSARLLQPNASNGKSVAAESGSARVAPEPAGALPGSPQPAPAEWVQVFVRGTAVAIVVRDTSLSADEAMQCAFQTARELTGRSDALRHLTLNGRTIYQQRHASDSQVAAQAATQSASVLEFAC